MDIINALLGGGLAAVVLEGIRLLYGRRRDRTETVRAEGDILDQFEKFQARLVAAELRFADCERESADLRAWKARVEAILPFALIGQRFEEWESLREMLDGMSDPAFITSPADGGTLLFANRVFCELINRPLDEILHLGWRRLVHPVDLTATSATEASAWHGAVRDFVNRYPIKGGGMVTFRWRCPAYSRGVTLAIARVESIDAEEPTAIASPRIPVRSNWRTTS